MQTKLASQWAAGSTAVIEPFSAGVLPFCCTPLCLQ